MAFVINLNENFGGYESSYTLNNSRPDHILEFYNSLISSLDYENSMLNQAINNGTEAVVSAIMEAAAYPLNVSGAIFPAGALSAHRASVDLLKTEPPVMWSELIVVVDGLSITSIGTIFDTPKVEFKCTDRLYIEDNYFINCSTLIINDRYLTLKEIDSISQNILNKCSMDFTLTLSIDQNIMPNIDDVREYISEEPDIKALILEHISDLAVEKNDIVLMLNKYAVELEKCRSDYYPKIIDVSCSGIDGFDFSGSASIRDEL